MNLLTMFKLKLYTYLLALISRMFGKKDLNILIKAVSGKLACTGIQLLQEASDILKVPCLLRSVHFVLDIWLCFTPSIIQINVFLQR